MDLSVVQSDTTPIPFALTDINGDPVITVGTMTFDFESGLTVTPSFTPTGTGTLTPSSAMVASPGTFRASLIFTNDAGSVETRPLSVVVLPTTSGYDPYDTATFSESASVSVS